MSFDPTTAAPEGAFDPSSAAPDTTLDRHVAVLGAVKANPVQAAEAARLAKRYKAPEEVALRNLDELTTKELVDELGALLDSSPTLSARAAAYPFSIKQWRPDAPTLQKIESNFASVAAASAAQATLGISESIWRTPDAASRMVGYVASLPEKLGLPYALNPIRGVQQAIDLLGKGQMPVGGKLFAGTTDVADKIGAAQTSLSTDTEAFGSTFSDVATLGKNADIALAEAFKGNGQPLADVMTDPASWTSFLAQAVPSLALAAKSGGSLAFIGWLEGMEQSSNAADFEKRTGQKISDAEFTQAFAQTATVNAVLERTGLDKVLGAKGKGLSGISKAILAEGGTEGLQQINSNLAAVLSYDPEKSLSEGVLASVMGGAGAGGGLASVSAAASKVEQVVTQRQYENRLAVQGAQQLQDQLKLATGVALRESNPEEFRALVATMSQDAEVFVDAGVFNQLAPEVLAQMPQSVQDQLANQVTQDTPISVPVADVLTIAPGTPLDQFFTENSRLNGPESMSQAEAKDAGAKAQEFLAQEAQRVIQQATDQQAMQESSDRVRQGVLDQLNSVGRFRKDVNEAYATWTAAFYTTMGGRLGITPEEMQAKYPLKIAGQAGQGALLNAGGMEGELTVEGYHFSMADRPTLSTAMYGTGLKGSARDEILNNPDQRLKNRLSFYFDKGTGIRPESGVGGRAHRVQLTGVYDADADPLKLKTGNARELESKLLDLGYKGYANRMDGTQPGQVIMLGEQNFTPELLGAVSKIDTGQRVAPLETAAPQWKTQASGDPAMLQAKLERMQGMPGWANYDLRIEGNELQAREKGGLLEQAAKQKPGPDAPGVGLEEGNKLGFWPALRVKLTGKLKLPEKAPILTGTTNVNAAKQIAAIDGILKKFPKATESTAEWTKMMAYALGSTEVPIPPYAFIRDLNSAGSLDKLRTLTQGQIDDASHGFENAAEFRRAYVAGELGVETTGKLFMWSFLSRGVSPYTQEALFIDAFDGADKWIAMAARGEFTEAVFPEYEAWAKSVAPKGSGQPGAGATHNLNAFGQDFLFKMSRVGKDGKTHMQRLHDMMADPAQTGKNIRREFATFGEGVGIDNKVVSFTLLVAGFNDVMVLDRVQIRQLWDDGRFNGVNLYDGVSENKMVTGKDGVAKMKPVKLAGSSLNNLAEGARGILVYEAIERGLEAKIQQMYTELGRPQDGSIGRYHWETWVADSQQEASHGTLGAILADAKGDDQAIASVSAKQGEYGAYEYGALYNRDSEGTPWFGYDLPSGSGFAFSVPAFRAFLEDVKRPATGVVPTKFKVTESGNAPWYTRPEVNQDRLEERARYWADRAGGSGEGQRAIEETLQQQSADGAGPGAVGQPSQGEVNGQPEQTGDRGGRYSSGGLAPLEGAPDIRGATGPDPRLVAVAEQYARDNGIELKRQGEYAQVDPARAARITQAYAEMQHAPNDPQVKAAYADLIRQTQAQYEALVAAGYTFTFFDDTTDPYGGNPWDAMRDLRANQRMAVYGTYAGFGVGADINVGLADPAGGANLDPEAVLAAVRAAGGDVVGSVIHTSATEPTLVIKIATKLDDAAANDLSVALGQEAIAQSFEDGTGQLYGPQAANWGDYSPDFFVTADGRRASETLNPLLADTGLRWPDQNGVEQPVKANDLFRAVHDAFGHGLEGAGFRAQGEENAWQAHVRLFTGPAVGAITSETRGQNNWLNFGPYGERNQSAAVQDTVFAEQKTGLLPEWAWTEGRVADAPDVLKQGPRGTFNPKSLELALNENADLSTFLHETGHFFLEVMADLASQPGAPADITADMAALMKWFGVEDLATWNGYTLDQKRPYHERFAESFEQYLMEGKAPSLELQPLFRKFRAWMMDVYKNLKAAFNTKSALEGFKAQNSASPIQLSPEIRQVFDRMLASEEQIAQANEVAGLLPNEEADAEANEKLTARSLRDLKWTVNARAREIKKLQDQAKELRKGVEAEVAAEVDAMPEFQAKAALDKIRKETKLQPSDAQMETVAEQYGFTSVDEMLQSIANVGNRADVIEGMSDRRMLERHGDLVDQRAIEEAANEAVHNEARARSLATELRSQAEMMNPRVQTGTASNGSKITVNAIVEAAKLFAANVVARTKIIDLKAKAWQHTAAERRAGKRWQEATAAGKTQDAVKAKQDQVLNNAAAKAALEAADSMRKMLDYVKKFEKESVRKKLPVEYLDQIDQLLEAIDLRVSTTGKEIGRRKSLAQWVASQQALGLDPILPARLVENMGLTSFKDMTVDEFTDLTETIKNIEHLGRLKSKLLAAKDKREFDVIAEEIAQSIIANGGKALPTRLEPDGRISQFFKGAWADHRKLNSLVHQMDGGADNGPFYRAFVRSMNEAGANENVMLEKATEALAKIYAPIEKLPGGISGGKLFIPEIKNSLSRAGRLSVALNWGNEQNRQRVMDGDNWTEAQVNAILKTLTSVELQFVNNVWAHIDSYWPDVKAKQLRVSGVVEDKVEAVPFEAVASDGTVVQMRGGYYPIKYDGDRSIKADLNEAKERAGEIMRGAVARPTTRRGHTQARVDEVVGRPVKKDLSVITQHVNQVVHDLAWHEWFIDANRLLNDSRIQGAIRDHHGPEIVRTMMDNVNAIAVGDANRQGQVDKLLLLMRANVTRSIMGASLTTALLQPFGLTQSMARIGVVPVLKGAGRWAGDAMHMENTVAWINEKSDFMRLRSKTFNRELREISQRVQGKSKLSRVVDASLFMLMQKMQLVADVPTWVGQYEKALAGGVDESTAVALADEAVLASQGGGTTKDLAAVQRNNPFLTQFYSYFSTTLQLVAEKTTLTDFKNPRAVAGWLGDMALLTVIPAILPALITFLLKGGGDDDEPEEWAKRLAEWQASYLLGMFVGLRELPTLWSPFDYGGPPAAKVLNDGKRLVQQAGQGELDDPAVIATIGFMGTALGLPTTQLLRSYKGWLAWDEGDAPATSILFGPPPKN